MAINKKHLFRFKIALILILSMLFILMYIIMNGGLVILSQEHYPRNFPVPSSGITAYSSVIPDSETRTIIPKLLYYYRITSRNLIEILFEPPREANFETANGAITRGEIIYSDGRKQIIATPEKPLIQRSNGRAVVFVIELEELKGCDLTLSCNGYIDSKTNQRIICSAFNKLNFKKELKPMLRSKLDMLNQIR